MVRLYLPAMASVVLAAILVIATTWTTALPTSGWVASYRLRGFDPARVLSGWDLLFGDTTLNNPLWTLRWEVTFSLILPIVVVLAVLSRRWWPLTVVASLALILVGIEVGVGALRYLPPFLIGAVIAVKHESLREWAGAQANARRVRWGGIGVLILSLVLLNAHWSALGLTGGVPHAQALLVTLETLGATGLVLLAAYWPPARWLLSTGFFRWLGRISFSLYLVHVPIIQAMDAVFGSSLPVVRIALSLVIALGVAELFSRLVEQPAHRLAKRVGAAAAAVMSRVVPSGRPPATSSAEASQSEKPPADS
jgi:peptidoglycan/LPS O-acetylase OafA/YrhL